MVDVDSYGGVGEVGVFDIKEQIFFLVILSGLFCPWGFRPVGFCPVDLVLEPKFIDDNCNKNGNRKKLSLRFIRSFTWFLMRQQIHRKHKLLQCNQNIRSLTHSFQLLDNLNEHFKTSYLQKAQNYKYVKKNTNLNLKTLFICNATYCRSKTEYLPFNEFYCEKSFVTNWIKKNSGFTIHLWPKKKKEFPRSKENLQNRTTLPEIPVMMK